MPTLLNFRFPDVRRFVNCDNTELKKFPKIKFSVSERHRWEYWVNKLSVPTLNNSSLHSIRYVCTVNPEFSFSH